MSQLHKDKVCWSETISIQNISSNKDRADFCSFLLFVFWKNRSYQKILLKLTDQKQIWRRNIFINHKEKCTATELDEKKKAHWHQKFSEIVFECQLTYNYKLVTNFFLNLMNVSPHFGNFVFGYKVTKVLQIVCSFFISSSPSRIANGKLCTDTVGPR